LDTNGHKKIHTRFADGSRIPTFPIPLLIRVWAFLAAFAANFEKSPLANDHALLYVAISSRVRQLARWVLLMSQYLTQDIELELGRRLFLGLFIHAGWQKQAKKFPPLFKSCVMAA
jgi:hypothetical protein